MKTQGLPKVAWAAAAAAALLLGGMASWVAAQGREPAPPAADTQPAVPAGLAVATFAGGCFWCVEADFDKVPGVVSTTSGYTGGTVARPRYEDVAAKRTGHAEVVRIVFDPRQVRFEQLLAVYWRSIDPTTKDRQFCDAGSPYRTAIFTHDAAQATAAQASLQALQKDKPFAAPIVTTIEPAGAFYEAESYHQDYYKKNPVRYQYYRASCGRDARLKELWGTPR
jgi:peptide-methionine (S)-S-oxide reductase